MATDRDRLRLYLGDPTTINAQSVTPYFTDNQLDDLLLGAGGDVPAAAAEGWKQKAAFYASDAYDISLDGGTLSRGELFEHAEKMMKFWGEQSPAGAYNIKLQGPTAAAIDEEDEVAG